MFAVLLANVSEALPIRRPGARIFADAFTVGNVARRAIFDRNAEDFATRRDQNPFAGLGQIRRRDLTTSIRPLGLQLRKVWRDGHRYVGDIARIGVETFQAAAGFKHNLTAMRISGTNIPNRLIGNFRDGFRARVEPVNIENLIVAVGYKIDLITNPHWLNVIDPIAWNISHAITTHVHDLD